MGKTGKSVGRRSRPWARPGSVVVEIGGSPALSGHLAATTYRPLSEMVYTQLREAICEGTFGPGERLVQADLAQKLGVSRIPVREALHRLSEEGLVECTPHKGAIVRRPDPNDVEETWVAARVLVRVAMEHACARITDAQVARIARLHETMLRRAKVGRKGELAAMNRRFHLSIFVAGGLGKLYDCMDALMSCYPQTARAAITVRGRASLAEHEEILDALRARDLARLLAAADKHTVNNARTTMGLITAGNAADDCAAL